MNLFLLSFLRKTVRRSTSGFRKGKRRLHAPILAKVSITLVLLCAALNALGAELFVLYDNDSKIGRFDAAAGAVINASFITGIDAGGDVAVAGNALYVSRQTANSVAKYDASTGALINANFVTGLNFPIGLAVSGNSLYVTNYGDANGTTVGKFDATTGSPINANFITNAVTPTRLLISGSDLYVSNYWGGSVGKYHAGTGATVNAGFVSGLYTPRGLAVSGTTLFVTQIVSNTIGTYSASTGAAVSSNFITNASDSNSIAVLGNVLYAAQYTNNRVSQYNATTGAVINANFITGLPGVRAFTLIPGPTITVQPQPVTVLAGQPATFTVTSSGPGTLTYQWQKDGVDIPGATSSSLNIAGAQAWHIGAYRVAVTNAEGLTMSGAASLSVSGSDASVWTGLLNYYPFNAAPGDLTLQQNNFVNTNADLAPDRFNTPNSSYYFNGTSAWLITERNLAITGNSPRTFSFWIKIPAPGLYVGSPNLLAHGTKSGTGGLFSASLYTRPDIRHIFVHGDYYDAGMDGSSPLPVEQWCHFAVATDGTGTNTAFYVNGVRQSSIVPPSGSLGNDVDQASN